MNSREVFVESAKDLVNRLSQVIEAVENGRKLEMACKSANLEKDMVSRIVKFNSLTNKTDAEIKAAQFENVVTWQDRALSEIVGAPTFASNEFDVYFMKAVEGLMPEGEQKVVLAHYREELSYERIASKYGMTVEAARQLILRFNRRVRTHSNYDRLILGHSYDETLKRYRQAKKELDEEIASQSHKAYIEANNRKEQLEKETKEMEQRVREMRENPGSLMASDTSGSTVKNWMLKDMGFTPRALNSLSRGGFTTIGQVLEVPVPELRRLRNFGNISLEELREKTKEYGLTLKDDIPENMQSGVGSKGTGIDDSAQRVITNARNNYK